MRKIVAALGALALGVILTGCWEQPGFDAGRSNWNSGESTLSPANVAALTQLWDVEVGPSLNAPISRTDTLFLVEQGTSRVHALASETGTTNWTRDVVAEGRFCAFEFCPAYDPVYLDGRIVVPYLGYPGGSGPSRGSSITMDPRTGDWTEPGPGTGNYDTDTAIAGGKLVQLVEVAWPLEQIAYASIVGLGYTPAHLTYNGGQRYPVGADFAVVGERIAWSSENFAEGFSAACPPPDIPIPGGCGPDWRTPLDAAPGQPVAIGTGQVAFPTPSTTYVLDMATGAVLWTAPGGGGLAVAGDTIVVAAADRVFTLPAGGCGAATCAPLWEAPLVGAKTVRPVVAGGVVFVGNDAQVVTYDLAGCGSATCPALGTLDIGQSPTHLIVDDGRVIATRPDGHVVAFGLPGSLP